ncbi:radical SAM protein [Nocardia uniformis]|uniref:Radical SAM protein n=2 Tax=Nocardia uniformis TaxID=53432 RepID=A0A849CCC7_9NOCA|nr:radical SAM protein [Nocardia uniformis]NNH73697.1 radical SAM protein [Nocardia uniformis]
MTNLKIIDESCRFRPPAMGRLVLWELTRFCNLACRHCCTGSSPAISMADDVPTDAAIASLRQLEDAGVRELYLTGGEPLARRDFIELLEAAGTAKDLSVFVATNGIFIRDRHITAFRSAGVRSITISMDGHDAESHDAIRGPGAFQKAEKGIRRCVEARLPVRLSHMITPTNLGNVRRFCQLAVDLGVPTVALHTVIPAGTAVSSSDLVMSASRTSDVASTMAAVVEEFSSALSIQHGMDGSSNPAHCIAGQQLLHISPNGDVSPCSWMYKLDKRFTLGNLRHESLLDCIGKLDSVVGEYAGKPGCPIPMLSEQSMRRRTQDAGDPTR